MTWLLVETVGEYVLLDRMDIDETYFTEFEDYEEYESLMVEAATYLNQFEEMEQRLERYPKFIGFIARNKGFEENGWPTEDISFAQDRIDVLQRELKEIADDIATFNGKHTPKYGLANAYVVPEMVTTLTFGEQVPYEDRFKDEHPEQWSTIVDYVAGGDLYNQYGHTDFDRFTNRPMPFFEATVWELTDEIARDGPEVLDEFLETQVDYERYSVDAFEDNPEFIHYDLEQLVEEKRAEENGRELTDRDEFIGFA